MTDSVSYDDLLEVLREGFNVGEPACTEQILWTMLLVQVKHAKATTRLLEKIEWRLMRIANDAETIRLRR